MENLDSDEKKLAQAENQREENNLLNEKRH